MVSIASSAAAALLALVCAAAAFIAALDAGSFRNAVIAYEERRLNRPIRVEGPLRLQLWSRHPRIVAEGVTIGSPPWMAAGDLASMERLTLTFAFAGIGLGAVLESISMEGAMLHLTRDTAGRANWQRFDPNSGKVGKGLPLIRELTAHNAHLVFDDQLRHLQFDGIVTAQGERPTGAARLHVEGKGQLNGKTASLELNGDPLATVRRDKPYAFEFMEEASASRVVLHGSLPQPFDFNILNGTFEADGENLRDLYFLTGMKLVNTGGYRLSGSIERRGTRTGFDDLRLTTGQSKVAGSLSSDLENGRAPQGDAGKRRSLLQGSLTAEVLHLADFGARAAHGPDAAAPTRLFPDTVLNVEGLRRSDSSLRFDAHRLDIGRTVLRSVSGEMKIDHGVLTIDAPKAELMQGHLQARIKLDANQPVPAVDVNMTFKDLQLAALDRDQSGTPLDGPVEARIDISGLGSSFHQVAASANGSVRVMMPHGTIRASLAELTGVDLRGLGLTLTRSKRETRVRCAAAVFTVHEGTLTAKTLFIDTVPVLIEGQGLIDLDSESLDIALRGHPKDVRLLRLDTPVLIRGTLLHPSFGIRAKDSSVKLIDPGQGESVDCEDMSAI